MRRPVAAEHPPDAGDADCHSPAGFAMTCFFVSLCVCFAAESIENHCHCEPVRRLVWQSVFHNAKHCVAPSGRQRYPCKRSFIFPWHLDKRREWAIINPDRAQISLRGAGCIRLRVSSVALTREPDTANTVGGKDAHMGVFYCRPHCTWTDCNADLLF